MAARAKLIMRTEINGWPSFFGCLEDKILIDYFFMFIQAMTDMNKVMDPQKTAKTMQEFTKQSAKMDMTEEMSKFFFFADSVEDIFVTQLWWR